MMKNNNNIILNIDSCQNTSILNTIPQEESQINMLETFIHYSTTAVLKNILWNKTTILCNDCTIVIQ